LKLNEKKNQMTLPAQKKNLRLLQVFGGNSELPATTLFPVCVSFQIENQLPLPPLSDASIVSSTSFEKNQSYSGDSFSCRGALVKMADRDDNSRWDEHSLEDRNHTGNAVKNESTDSTPGSDVGTNVSMIPFFKEEETGESPQNDPLVDNTFKTEDAPSFDSPLPTSLATLEEEDRQPPTRRTTLTMESEIFTNNLTASSTDFEDGKPGAHPSQRPTNENDVDSEEDKKIPARSKIAHPYDDEIEVFGDLERVSKRARGPTGSISRTPSRDRTDAYGARRLTMSLNFDGTSPSPHSYSRYYDQPASDYFHPGAHLAPPATQLYNSHEYYQYQPSMYAHQESMQSMYASQGMPYGQTYQSQSHPDEASYMPPLQSAAYAPYQVAAVHPDHFHTQQQQSMEEYQAAVARQEYNQCHVPGYATAAIHAIDRPRTRGSTAATPLRIQRTQSSPEEYATSGGEFSSQFRRGPSQEELEEARTQRARGALTTWYQRLEDLYRYKMKHGHCRYCATMIALIAFLDHCSPFFFFLFSYDLSHTGNVPQKFSPNHALGIWVNKQRMEKKSFDEGNERSSMTQRKIDSLNAIGFVWAKRKGDASWNEKYRELQEYKERFGNCEVPTKYPANPALGRWVSTQRSNYKDALATGDRRRMSLEKQQLLESIGFRWKMMQSGCNS